MVMTQEKSSWTNMTSGIYGSSHSSTSPRGWSTVESGYHGKSKADARVNVGNVERKVSLAAGAILAGLAIARRDLTGALIAAVGGGLLFRGATGRCMTYHALGVNTASESDRRQSRHRGILVSETFLIDKPAGELYAFWRKLENLPAIMSHLESVRVINDRRSHWVATAPSIAGGRVEWDAQITDEQPSKRIAWRSLPDADVDNRGLVEFIVAPGDRGTVVRVRMEYLPPAGQLGRWVAKLFGEAPEQQIREDLRRFKRVMETGEAITIDGQPRGSCAGILGRISA